jgi:hypothetical protein
MAGNINGRIPLQKAHRVASLYELLDLKQSHSPEL